MKMTAKDMFEKLGYEVDINILGIIRYAKHDKGFDLDYYIRFHNDLKEFSCNMIEKNEILPLNINIKLLQCINKQIEELGWND